MIARLDQWAAGLQGAPDDTHQFELLFAECDLALGNARGVEQIIYQPRQMLRLAVNHVTRLLKLWLRWAKPAQ